MNQVNREALSPRYLGISPLSRCPLLCLLWVRGLLVWHLAFRASRWPATRTKKTVSRGSGANQTAPLP